MIASDAVSPNDKQRLLPTEKSRQNRHMMPTFLPCHLKILKSLYTEENNNSNNQISNDWTDGIVSDEVWEMIQKFLDQRHNLLRIKFQAIQYRSIANESKDYVQRKQQQLHQHHHHYSMKRNSKYIPKSPIPSHRIPISPLEKRLFVSPISNVITKSSSQQTSIMSSNRKTNPSPKLPFSCSLHMASRLLDHTARVAENTACTSVQPFQELYVAVSNRAQRLDSLLATSNDKRGETDDDMMSEWSRNKLLELEVKLRLWRKLANDLFSILKEN
jgi:hypothetical protein